MTVANFNEDDIFVCDLSDISFKDIHQEMEHPFYALSKKPDHNIREYKNKNINIKITPSYHGMPTIYDKDVLVFCISKLMYQKREGLPISKKVFFSPAEYFRFTERSINNKYSQKDSIALERSIERLQGMQIKTNIKTGKKREKRIFSLIADGGLLYEEDEDGNKESLICASVELSDWVFNSIESNEVLTLNRKYFKLSRPIEKRLYEMFRKHCGKQALFEISIQNLHYKSGSLMQLKRFKHELKAMVKDDNIPDYCFRVSDDGIVSVTYKDYIEPEHFELPEISDSALSEAKKILNATNIDDMVDQFYSHYKKKNEKLLNPDKAFLGFVNFRVQLDAFSFSDFY